MPPKFTQKKFKNSGHAPNTEEPSRALKNTLPKAHQVGLESEGLVKKYFLSEGYQLLGERIRTPFAEVDLVLSKADLLLIVEVKSLSNSDFFIQRVSKRQKLRLKNAQIYFQEKYQKLVEIIVVYVQADYSIIKIPLSEL